MDLIQTESMFCSAGILSSCHYCCTEKMVLWQFFFLFWWFFFFFWWLKTSNLTLWNPYVTTQATFQRHKNKSQKPLSLSWYQPGLFYLSQWQRRSDIWVLRLKLHLPSTFPLARTSISSSLETITDDEESGEYDGWWRLVKERTDFCIWSVCCVRL